LEVEHLEKRLCRICIPVIRANQLDPSHYLAFSEGDNNWNAAMAETRKSNFKGAGFALVAFGLFATHDVVVKSLGASFATFQIVFFSVLLSFPLVSLMLMRDATQGTLIPVHPWWTALRTGAAILTGSAAFYAFSILPLTEVYAILFAGG